MKLPQIQVAADVVVWDESNERVLLIRRSLDSNAYPGFWALPGGLVEEDETVEQAAVREVMEETGISVSVQFVRYVDWPFYRDPRCRSVSFVFIGIPLVSFQDIKAGSDASDVKWFKLHDAIEMDLAFDHKAV